MTKHSILAVVIPALLMISVVDAAEIYNKNGNKLSFYGKVVGEHGFTTSGEQKNIDSSYNQISFKGETQINSQIIGYGQWEYHHAKSSKVEGNQDNGGITNLAFAGIRINDVGSLDYGRNYNIMYDVTSYTNKLPVFSRGGSRYTDNYINNHSSGLLTYRNSNFFGLVDGLNVGIQYQSKNEYINPKQNNGDGVGISLEYETGEGFGLIGVYNSANRIADQKSDSIGGKAEYWAVGAKYDMDNIYLATVYAETRNMSPLGNGGSSTVISESDERIYNIAEKTQNFELTAQYQFDFGLRPSISYVQSKSKNLHSISSDRNLVKYVTTGATYFFNKNFNIYGNYRFNLLNKESESINWLGFDNQATVGVAYQF